jgi:hypothetical protein
MKYGSDAQAKRQHKRNVTESTPSESELLSKQPANLAANLADGHAQLSHKHWLTLRICPRATTHIEGFMNNNGTASRQAPGAPATVGSFTSATPANEQAKRQATGASHFTMQHCKRNFYPTHRRKSED